LRGFSSPTGILFDGHNIWVADQGLGRLLKLDAGGNVVHSIVVGVNPRQPVFDGINIWVPNSGSNSVTVVRAKDVQGNPLASPFVLATLVGNGLEARKRQLLMVNESW
jgi:DNA-binding beta-propeller fold protein YncE